VHAVVEVRQVVLPRPLLDLATVPLRAAVAIGSVAVVLLEKLLILAPEIPFEDYALDFGTLVAQTFLDLPVRPKQLCVVLEFTGATEAGVERLVSVVPVTAMRLEHIPTTVGQDSRAFVRIDRNEPDQALIAQVVQRVVAGIGRGVADVVQVSFGHHPKRSDRGEHPAVLAIQFVQVLALVLNQLALQPARQIQAVHKRVTRIALAWIALTLARSRGSSPQRGS
jgi:hypothetical protein